MLNEWEDYQKKSEGEKYGRDRDFNLRKMSKLTKQTPKLLSEYKTIFGRYENYLGYHINEIILAILFMKYVLKSERYYRQYKSIFVTDDDPTKVIDEGFGSDHAYDDMREWDGPAPEDDYISEDDDIDFSVMAEANELIEGEEEDAGEEDVKEEDAFIGEVTSAGGGAVNGFEVPMNGMVRRDNKKMTESAEDKEYTRDKGKEVGEDPRKQGYKHWKEDGVKADKAMDISQFKNHTEEDEADTIRLNRGAGLEGMLDFDIEPTKAVIDAIHKDMEQDPESDVREHGEEWIEMRKDARRNFYRKGDIGSVISDKEIKECFVMAAKVEGVRENVYVKRGDVMKLRESSMPADSMRVHPASSDERNGRLLGEMWYHSDSAGLIFILEGAKGNEALSAAAKRLLSYNGIEE